MVRTDVCGSSFGPPPISDCSSVSESWRTLGRPSERYTAVSVLRKPQHSSAIVALCLLPLLGGCLRTTHSVMRTYPPSIVMSQPLEQLEKDVAARYNAVQTMNASIEITASTGGGTSGQVVQYSTFSGYLLLRKPGDLRVILFLPIAHLRALDMVTDGKTFTMLIPPKNRAITGSNDLTKPSKNPLENLRPGVFYDSLMVRSAGEGELISRVSDNRIYQPDPRKKYFVDEPEYDLGFYRLVPGSPELKTERVVHIGRSTLMPYQQDIYDQKGQLVTVATYENYQKFGETLFPAKITIQRPTDQLKLVLVITKLAVNQKLEDDQFQLKIPENTQVQTMQ